MKLIRTATLLAFGLVVSASGQEDFFDQLSDALTVSSPQGAFSSRVSGTLDLEGYYFRQPAPALIYAPGRTLLNPRLTVFLDAQLGSHIYLFVQARADRGFDPAAKNVEARFDEYALRFTPGQSGHFGLQIGKYAAVVGNWVPRHGSWDNPFVTAPLPYENLTGIWESAAARTSGILLAWAHVIPTSNSEYSDKHLRSPVFWGPSYASGAAVFGEFGRVNYAVEIKNAALASQPHSWNFNQAFWEHPTFNARIGYRPNVMWNLGLSGSTGSYLIPSAAPTVAPGFGRGDYRQVVLAQDIGFAWRYWQVWAEFFHTRFEVPRVGHADTFAYYTEVKYKFTPQFFGALRWNQQTFGDIKHGAGGQMVAWGRDSWRLDLATTYRFTPHLQFKVQCSLQREKNIARNFRPIVAAQLTARF